MTITYKNDEMKPDRTFFAYQKKSWLRKIGISLRFGGFVSLFLLNPKYLVVFLLLVLLLLIIERFQLTAATAAYSETELQPVPANRVEPERGFRKSALKPVRPKIRWENELKDREYEKKVEEIFARIRESTKEEYQQGIEEIQKLLHLRQQNLNQSILTRALR